mgnify:CR=1 FL=1
MTTIKTGLIRYTPRPRRSPPASMQSPNTPNTHRAPPESASARNQMTGRTSAASRASVSARGPRPGPIAEGGAHLSDPQAPVGRPSGRHTPRPLEKKREINPDRGNSRTVATSPVEPGLTSVTHIHSV